MGEAGIEIEALRRGYEAMNRRDWEAASQLLGEDVEWHDPAPLPDAGVHRGKAAVRRNWERFDDSWEDWAIELEELIPSGDHFFVRARLSGRGRESGVDVSLEYFQVWTFSGGLVVLQRAYAHRSEALSAAGIEPDA